LSSLQTKVTGTSSSHQRVNPLDIINYEVVLPQIELFDRFYHSTYGFIQKIEKNALENIQLTTLRDTLLPKLISGELEVSKIQTAS
jgi:type I restriction enzyme S subunit